MRKRLQSWCFLALSVAILSALAACSPLSMAATPTVLSVSTVTAIALTASPTVAATATVAATPTLAPTATVVPTATASATSTPAPTLTPPPTATIPPPTATTAPTATVPPTAVPTLAPTALPTAVPPPPPPPPTATLPPPPPPQPTTTGTDARNLCAVTLPTGFTQTGPGAFSGVAGRVTLTLTALAADPGDTLDDVAVPYISAEMPKIGGYQQTKATKGTDSLRIDFTGQIGQPGNGTFYLRQFGQTVCTVSFFMVQGTDLNYEATLTQLLASLRAAGAVGTRPTIARHL